MQEEINVLPVENLNEAGSTTEKDDRSETGHNTSNEALGWEVYKFLSKIPYDKIAFGFMVLIVIQPLVGLFWPIHDIYEYSFYCHLKANIIRIPGCVFVVFSLLSNFKNKALFGREYTKRTYLKNPWVLLLTIIVILGYVSCFYSEDPIKSLKGHGYLWQGFVGILCYAGIFGAASLISDEKQKRFLLNLHVIVSVILAAATLLAAECGLKSLLFERSTFINVYSATFINQNPYGYYLCVSIVICAGLFAHEKKMTANILYLAAMIINIVVLVRNKSLGPYLAVWVGLLMLSVLCIIRGGKKCLRKIIILLIVCLAASLLSTDGSLIKDLKQTFKEGAELSEEIKEGIESGDMESAITNLNAGSYRMTLWKNTITAIAEKPILGRGLDTMSSYLGKHTAQTTTPHNEYLELAAELGIPAAIMYVAALLLLFISSVKHIKDLPDMVVISGCVVAAYAFNALFAFSMPPTNCFMFMALGLTNSWHKNKDYVELLKEQIEK